MLSIGFTTHNSAVNDSILFDAMYSYVVANENGSAPEESNAGSQKLTPGFGENSSFSFDLDAASDSTSTPKDSVDNFNLFQNKFGTDTTKTKLDTAQARIDSIARDSLKAIQDSMRLYGIDSTLAPDSLFLDSTARMEQFHFQRKDLPYTTLFQKKHSKFFAYPSQTTAQRVISLDSTGQFVEIKEVVAGEEPKIKLRMPIDEFIRIRMDTKNREIWESLAYKYELLEDQGDLSKLITDITNIDIPLPSVGFLSIFGRPNISLKIGGAVDIHGAWRSETTEGVTASLLGNTRNEPDFKQQVQINVNGKIGDKLTIAADWNTERTFEYENQLKLEYTGFEDEIVRKVQAGNVSLQASPLVGGSDALFGIKAEFQLGPLYLTTIASQKKGESKEVSISGGSTSSEFTIHAYDYSKNHFFVDQIYADPAEHIFSDYYLAPTPRPREGLVITEIEVWKSVKGIVDPNRERQAIARIDLESIQSDGNYDRYREDANPKPGEVEVDRFVKLDPSDFSYQAETGYITVNSVADDEAIAVAFRNENKDIMGEFTTMNPDTSKLLILKLVKPKNLQPQYKQAWALQLKNMYPIGGRNINEEGFKLDLYYQEPGQEPNNTPNGVALLNVFNLDRYNASKTEGRDGNFDFLKMQTINQTTGEIIFPVLQPFGDDFPKELPDSLKYDDVYDTTYNIARLATLKDRFIIKGEYSASSTSTFNLGFVGVVENSVKVTLAGRELTPNVDFVVDYSTGQVTIRNEDALVPGAQLKISYEQNDIFQMASKTFLGALGEIKFSPKTMLRLSAFNLNQQTLSDKVRIGEEPLNNSIYGADFSTSIDLPFLTKGINNLISTKAMSNLTFKGEVAYMNPEPNTKTSTIEGDGGRSIAYIDDFEGAKKTTPIGISYTSWHEPSIPIADSIYPGLSKQDIFSLKAKSYWFGRYPSGVGVKDIWPEKYYKTGEDQVTVLDYVFLPNKKGTYNQNYQPFDYKNKWGGMMKILSSTATNLIDENIEFIEFWVQFDSSYAIENPARHRASEDAKLFIDIGQISEDVNVNGTLQTEDANGNDAVDNGEDVGQDGIPDQLEPGYDPVNLRDPNGDNYSYQQGSINYEQINGTEGNAISIDAGKLPDTEDLNNTKFLEKLDSYFRYSIPLSINKELNPFITGGENNRKGWRQIRIPLKDFVDEIGSPSLSNVNNIRLWVTNADDTVHLRLADFNFVGSQWQKVVDAKNPDDETLGLAVVNLEENGSYYSSPPGVKREKDRTDPNQEIYRNEQSLSVSVKKLNDGDERQVIKNLRSMDMFNYREMKLFIHSNPPGSKAGDDLAEYTDENNYASEVYFRFGSDTMNYYEYRFPLRDIQKDNNWEDISIVFDDLTALKQTRDSLNKIPTKDVAGKPGHIYAVRGNPSLTKISFMMFGIENPAGKGVITPVSGDVWFNELRVIGADDREGLAYTTSTKLNLADVVTGNFNLSKTDPYFHKLSDKFGSRNNSFNWNASLDVDVLKLLPFNMPGSNLRVNYSRTESKSTPLYQPGTDIKVDKAAEGLRTKGVAEDSVQEFINSTKTENVSETWSLSSIKLKLPTNYWLIRDTFNSLNFSFSFNKTKSFSPTVLAASTWQWNFSTNYSVNLSPTYYFQPSKIPVIGTIVNLFSDYKNAKIYYTPQSFSWSFTAARNYSFSQQRVAKSLPVVSRDFKTTRNAGFNWRITEGGLLNISTSYNLDFSSTLQHLLTRREGDLEIDRRESEIWREIFSSAFFGKNTSFSQNLDIKTQPKLPTIWGIGRYFTINGGYGVNYQWVNNPLQPDLGRSAGFSNKISANMTIKLKSIFDPLFKDDVESSTNTKSGNQTQDRQGNQTQNRRGNDRRGNQQPGLKGEETNKELNISTDSLKTPADSIAVVDTLEGKSNKLANILHIVKLGFKWLFFDYETIQATYSQDNSVQKTGLQSGASGFNNFWGYKTNDYNGPSRSFMLGFSQNAGPRAPMGNLTDNFTQKHNLDFKTSRPLWEGATIDVRWKVSWQNSNSVTVKTDEFGNTTLANPNSTGSITRSFILLPLPLFGGGLKKVNELYQENKDLTSAFVKGFETFSLIGKIPLLQKFINYLPRPNWSITWDGLEKYPLFKSVTKRASLQHAYTSDYSEGWKIDQEGNTVTQSQKVNYGFAPLIGLNLTFDSFWEGNMSGNIKYGTRTAYDVGTSTRNITESFSNDIGVTATYSKSGLEIPLFGVSLKNDIEISFSYTRSQNKVINYSMDAFKEAGTPQDGNTRTTMEPRIKVVMSSKVTASIFYRRSSTTPEGASRTPATTTNEAGLDVHISIQ